MPGLTTARTGSNGVGLKGGYVNAKCAPVLGQEARLERRDVVVPRDVERGGQSAVQLALEKGEGGHRSMINISIIIITTITISSRAREPADHT